MVPNISFSDDRNTSIWSWQSDLLLWLTVWPFCFGWQCDLSFLSEIHISRQFGRKTLYLATAFFSKQSQLTFYWAISQHLCLASVSLFFHIIKKVSIYVLILTLKHFFSKSHTFFISHQQCSPLSNRITDEISIAHHCTSMQRLFRWSCLDKRKELEGPFKH